MDNKANFVAHRVPSRPNPLLSVEIPLLLSTQTFSQGYCMSKIIMAFRILTSVDSEDILKIYVGPESQINGCTFSASTNLKILISSRKLVLRIEGVDSLVSRLSNETLDIEVNFRFVVL